LTSKGTTVELAPLLLNKDDFISVEVLLTAFSRSVTHSARIVGVPEVKLSYGRPSVDRLARGATSAAALIVALAGVGSAAPLAIEGLAISRVLLPIFFALLGTSAGFLYGNVKQALPKATQEGEKTSDLPHSG
jgi:hypothetical protein